MRDPFRAVVALLADEFGEAKLFRPNRDVRFSADKSPYKTHQGLFVQVAPACGFYCEVNSTEAIAVGGSARRGRKPSQGCGQGWPTTSPGPCSRPSRRS